MKGINIFTIISLLALITVACKDRKELKKENTTSEIAITDEQNIDNSPNWKGSYFGIIPCASCPGINTLITLNENGTYEKTVEYLGSDNSPKTMKGELTWDKEKSKITLEEDTYLVDGGKLFMLDKEGELITGELAENYILFKTELELQPDVNEGYYLHQFTGDDDNEYNIIFNTNPKIPTAFVQSKDFKQMLVQTQAWAKGAEYESGNLKLIAGKNKTSLFINNREIKLKEK